MRNIVIQLLFRVSHNTYTDKNPDVCVKTPLPIKMDPVCISVSGGRMTEIRNLDALASAHYSSSLALMRRLGQALGAKHEGPRLVGTWTAEQVRAAFKA